MEPGAQANHASCRGLPRLQIFAVLEPGHAIPYQSRMLPQNVRVVRGQNILFRACELPRSGVPQDTEKESISQADIRGYKRREGGRYTAQSYDSVSLKFFAFS